MKVEELAREAVHCAYTIHVEFGPGLLESVYEAVLAKSLEERGLRVVRQRAIPIRFRDFEFEEGFRADLIVEDLLLIELKSVEKPAPVHAKQVLTYLRLLNLPLGLLINFGAGSFKEAVQRVANRHSDFSASSLRIHGQNAKEPLI